MASRLASSSMSPLTVISHKTIADKVYEQLREAIMSGRFAPGLPLSLRSVADAVGSSTMPVRAALTRLQAEGALIDGPGRALVVPPMTPGLLEELRDVRIALEGCVAERAATRMTEANLHELQTIFDEMNVHAQAGSSSAYLHGNFAFHSYIYRHGASDLTLATIQNMWLRIGPFFNIAAPDIAHMQRSMLSHRQIIEALWQRDGGAAKAGIAADIYTAAESLLERLHLHAAAELKHG
ncbi:GntR family transcriptional regulator [Paraburkholderia hayleyella]|uniref:GntR family transcriptional regulator n=1 Tax=Paraburkholderia hayleyella TaxID=2152889 RepID=UPI001290F50F|nr:GntR family transcriptional regulator [Paraburkholderia hayleyella]